MPFRTTPSNARILATLALVLAAGLVLYLLWAR